MKSVQFKTIDITNFLSVGKTQHIDFSDGITAIFGVNHDKANDTNGVGKSTILSAVCFALYGDPIKSVKREEVVNRIAGGKCEVKLDFDVVENGKTIECTVVRGVKPSFCRLIMDGKDVSLSGMPETTKRIGEIIGTNVVMFKNTCLMSLEDNIPFARQKAAEKREFIEGVFDLGFIKVMAKEAKVRADKFASENADANSRIDEIRNQIVLYEKGEDDFETDRKTRISAIEERIAGLERQLKELDGKIESVSEDEAKRAVDEKAKLDERLADCDRRDSELNSERTEIIRLGTEIKGKIALQRQRDEDHAKELEEIEKTAKEYDIDDYRDFLLKNTEQSLFHDIVVLEEFIKKVDENIASEKVSLAQCRANIDALKSKGNICTACGRPFPENDIAERDVKIRREENRTNDLLKSIGDLGFARNRANGKLDAIKDKRYCLDSLQRMVKKYDSYSSGDVASLEKQLDALRGRAVENANGIKAVIAEKADISKSMESVNQTLSEIKAKLAENRGIRDHMDTIMSEIKASLEEKASVTNAPNKFAEYKKTASENLSSLEVVRDRTEHDCEIHRVIRDILSDDGFRSYMVKQYVAVLNNQVNKYLGKLDAPIRLEFDEYLDDRIVDQLTGCVCSYDSLSGGEKRRVDIACLLSFSDLRRLRGDVLFSHAFYDEILDSALSPGACGKLMGILKERFDEQGESSMIITHKQEMQEDPNIGHRILVEKIGGVSRISNG